jgi:O-antigen ligase
MFNLNELFRSRAMLVSALVFLYPLFLNTIRHWASSVYVLIFLFSISAVKQYKWDLKKEEKIFLIIIFLHVLAVITSNMLAGWTYASNRWFFSGEIRLLLAIPIYLYLRRIPEIWKWLLYGIPIGAIMIGLTGIIDFSIRYYNGDVEMIIAEGIYGHIYQGNISALLSVLSFAAFEYFKHHKQMRMICLVGAFIAAMGALVSVTRNAWLSLILLYMLVFIMQGGVRKIVQSLGVKKIAAMAAILVPVMYFFSGIEFLSDRLTQVYKEPVAYFTADRSKTLEYTSIGVRFEQWRGGMIAFSEKPLLGHGVGNIGKVNNRYIREGKVNDLIYNADAENQGRPAHIHSAYFEFLADTGIVGFVLLILLIYYAPFVAFKARKYDGIAWKFVVLHGVAFGIASLTEVPFIRNNWTSVFLILEIVFFVWLMAEKNEFETNQERRLR